MGIAAVVGCKEDIVDRTVLAVVAAAAVVVAASEAFLPVAVAAWEVSAVPIEIAYEDLVDFPAVHLDEGMEGYTQVLEQILVFGREVVLHLVVAEGSFEEDTVQEDQVCHNLEVVGRHVPRVQVEVVVHRSYSMSILDRLGWLLGWHHARILILSLDRLCFVVFQRALCVCVWWNYMKKTSGKKRGNQNETQTSFTNKQNHSSHQY